MQKIAGSQFADRVTLEWLRKLMAKRPKAYLWGERLWNGTLLFLFWLVISDLLVSLGIHNTALWQVYWPVVLIAWWIAPSIYVPFALYSSRPSRTIAALLLALTGLLFSVCSVFACSAFQNLIVLASLFGIDVSVYLNWLNWLAYYLSLLRIPVSFEGPCWQVVERLISVPILIFFIGGNGANQRAGERLKLGLGSIMLGTIELVHVAYGPILTLLLRVRGYDGSISPGNMAVFLEKQGFGEQDLRVLRDASREKRTGQYTYRILFKRSLSVLVVQVSSGRVFVEALPFRDISWMDGIRNFLAGRFECITRITMRITSIDTEKLLALCHFEYRLEFPFRAEGGLFQQLSLAFPNHYPPRSFRVRDYFHDLPVLSSQAEGMVHYLFSSRRRALKEEGHAYHCEFVWEVPLTREKQEYRIRFENLKLLDYATKLFRLQIITLPRFKLRRFSDEPRLHQHPEAYFAAENLGELQPFPFWFTLEETP